MKADLFHSLSEVKSPSGRVSVLEALIGGRSKTAGIGIFADMLKGLVDPVSRKSIGKGSLVVSASVKEGQAKPSLKEGLQQKGQKNQKVLTVVSPPVVGDFSPLKKEQAVEVLKDLPEKGELVPENQGEVSLVISEMGESFSLQSPVKTVLPSPLLIDRKSVTYVPKGSLQGRDLMVFVEDKRSATGMRRSMLSSLMSERRLASFDKEAKIVPLVRQISDSVNTSFLFPENRLGEVSNVVRDRLFSEHSIGNSSDLSLDFWHEWSQKVDAQIIDKARIILKDGATGEIQLRLHPQRLGSVHVYLEVEGSLVFARFVVDNSHVKEIFQANSASIQQGLEQSGLSVVLDFSTSREKNSASYPEASFFSNSEGRKQIEQAEVIEVDLSDGSVQGLIDMMV